MAYAPGGAKAIVSTFLCEGVKNQLLFMLIMFFLMLSHFFVESQVIKSGKQIKLFILKLLSGWFFSIRLQLDKVKQVNAAYESSGLPYPRSPID